MVRRFLWSMASHWEALVTGGVVAAVLFLGLGLRVFDLPPLFYALFGIAAACVASYRTWRDEALRADDLSAKLREAMDRAAEEVIPDVSDGIYWLLLVAERHTLRREMVDIGSEKQNSIWIGDTPVSTHDCQWLSDLATEAGKRGMLPLQSGLYRPTELAEKILRVSRLRKRPIPAAPGSLHEARSRQPFTIDIGP